MSVMPYWLSLAGDLLPKIDESLRTPEIQAAYLDGIDRGYSILELASMYTTLSKVELRHIEKHWFKEWWPNFQPVEPILTKGFAVACEKALEFRKPVGCLWTCSHPAECFPDKWECGVAVSIHQVSLVIATPDPPNIYVAGEIEEERVWIVS